MALTVAKRQQAWGNIMSYLSRATESVAITKVELLAAFDAADDWVELEQASYNSALPSLARQNLTDKQKAQILAEVMRLRFEVS